MDLTKFWHYMPPSALNLLVRNNMVRKSLLKVAEEKLYAKFVIENEENWPRGIQEGRYLMLKNLLYSINKAVADGRISSQVSKVILNTFVGQLLLGQAERVASFVKEHGAYPPALLTISPTKRCNLYCKGCYASSSAGNAETLNYDVFNKILQDKKENWGSHFTVISGGEPLLYKDGDKTIFDVLENNRDGYFMMYTNGTLITKEVARKLAKLGNLTPAISVEGFEAETDERRGKGVYKKILQAMENLKEAGVPFGVSLTATKNNVDVAMSPEFTSFYFDKMGAIYGWIFQYMPIGRSYTTDLMITPQQRLALYKREQQMIRESNIFLVDFWNGGPYTVGCISAGRPGGYFYIDWNGNIAPCAFYPYYKNNIYDLYKNNKTLNHALFTPYFESIRKWQVNYGFNQPPEKVDNYIVPCIMRDHFPEALALINKHKAKPMDENAAEALTDASYHERMDRYGKEAKALTQKHWEREFKASEQPKSQETKSTLAVSENGK